MLYKTHMVGGLALGYLAFTKSNIFIGNIAESKTLLIVTGGLLLGSLLPDIDHGNSFISKKLKPISKVTSKAFKHREFTHSILGSLLILIFFDFILKQITIDDIYRQVFIQSLGIGIISHIFLDMLTPAGVVLFYPLSKKRIKLFNFKKKAKGKYKLIEKIMFTLFLATIVVIYIYYNWI